MSADVSRMLTDEEAAKIMGIKPRMLRSWRVRKIGPVWSKIGRLVRYEENTLYEWLKAQRVTLQEEQNNA